MSHKTRGAGIVIEIDSDDKRLKPYKVQFLNSEVHHYSLVQFNARVLWITGVALRSQSTAHAHGPLPTAHGPLNSGHCPLSTAHGPQS